MEGLDLGRNESHTEIQRLRAASAMQDLALLFLFVLPSLFAIAFIVRQYRTATALQRRQMLIAGAGALLLAVAIASLFAFR